MSTATLPASFNSDVFRQRITLESDTIRVMLVNGYTPNPAHARRSDAVAFEVTGAGYTAGGEVAAATIVEDATDHRTDVDLAGHMWADATITATGAVYYKARGGAPEDDELVLAIDFGAPVSSTAGPWTLAASSIRFQG